MDPKHWHIGLVGYGEVGRILAEDLRAQGLAVSACDLKLAGNASAAPLRTSSPPRTTSWPRAATSS
jgi:prephenate dehydrogenase